MARDSELTTTYLDRIVAAHRAAAGADERQTATLEQQSSEAPATRGFRAAVGAARGGAIISEVKRRSPSKGALHPDLDAAVLAGAYEAGGAAALSVLTDVEFFGGSAADLRAARAATSLPVLRKDFTVHSHDVFDARIMGADCILLIAAALDDKELAGLHALATDVGLDVLVEIHDEAELERAMRVGANLVGVNQRDLFTFEVDTARAERMAPQMPEGVVRVAESGVRDRADVERLIGAGYHAVLVGETLVRSGDPARAVRDLLGD